MVFHSFRRLDNQTLLVAKSWTLVGLQVHVRGCAGIRTSWFILLWSQQLTCSIDLLCLIAKKVNHDQILPSENESTSGHDKTSKWDERYNELIEYNANLETVMFEENINQEYISLGLLLFIDAIRIGNVEVASS